MRKPPRARQNGWCGRSSDVRYWHLADILSCAAHVRFWLKRTCRPVSNRWFRLSVCYALWLGADMKRREFIALLGSAAAALPLAAAAQPKIPRIGFMGNSTAALEANLLDAFREGLRELGTRKAAISSLNTAGRMGSMTIFQCWWLNSSPQRWMRLSLPALPQRSR